MPGRAPMTRRRFSEREVIAALLHQGVAITCYRTREPITLDSVKRLEREHLVELGLIEPERRHLYDAPEYCRYSLKEAHAVVTNGNGATSAGSSKHRIAKAVRLEKARLALAHSGQVGEGKPKRKPIVRRPLRGRSAWPESRKLQSRPFPKRQPDAAE